MTPEQVVIEAARNLVSYEDAGAKESPPWLYWEEHFRALKDSLEALNRAEKPDESNMVNAKLIAAAPDLLEFVQAIAASTIPEFVDYQQTARDLLAKVQS